ncbi:MAG: recombinase RecJ, partial [Firmicutes bacterium]|nr:recombinase RecJ [Bacillota bacterium]
FNFDDFSKVSTALYYGLYSDTGGFTEITHPLDMDMRDNLRHDKALFKRLKNCNLSMEDLAIAGSSLIVPVVDKANQSAIFPARPCDPNVLGFISDLALQADSVETCVVFCEVSGGIKLSVRSCVKEIMAYELAQQLCLGCGSGGGHAGKAGGYISGDYIAKSGKTPLEFLSGRYQNYFKQYDLVYAGKYHPDLSEFERYEKLKIPVGFVRTTDIFPEGTGMIVRTLEGDTPVTSGQDIYIMVGIRQEIYPIKRAKFEASYKELDGEYRVIPQLLPENHYKPAVKNSLEGITEQIERFIRPCVSIGEVKILAKQIPKDTKVFTTWNPEGYMFGKAGDWLAIRADDPNDIYIIENTIFKIIYGRA